MIDKVLDWIDAHTRVVFIEFIAYENADRIFSSIQLVAEMPPIGNFYTKSTNVRSFRNMLTI